MGQGTGDMDIAYIVNLHKFTSILTLLHVQNSRDVFFPGKKNACGMLPQSGEWLGRVLGYRGDGFWGIGSFGFRVSATKSAPPDNSIGSVSSRQYVSVPRGLPNTAYFMQN